jgi:putative membrane protein
MRYVYKFALLILLLALFGFALKNDQPVVLRYYLGYEWHAPFVFYLFIFFAAGVGFGILASLAYIFRHRREVTLLKRELRSRQQASSLERVTSDAQADAS